MATTPIHGVGSRIGPYRVEELLGRGGMGVVYRATDPRLGRPVALKLLSPELSGDARFRARFERESRLAASIDHAGIVPVYEAGDADGQMYIAMRYVDGSDLAQLLRREGPLEPSRALDLVGQLAEALDAAHARGLLHRDVKPSNALIAREGAREHLYLADFGLTKTAGPDSTVAGAGTDSVTATGQVMGTVAYMAPEVIRGAEPSPAADLYALGCVLFECLAGEVPFPGANAAAVIYRHLETPPPRVHDRAPGLPAALDPVLARALAKEPAKRFESGTAMVEAARAALAEPPRGGRRLTRSALLAGAALVAAVAAVVVALWPGGATRIARVRGNAVAAIDPQDHSLRAQVALDGPPADVATAPNAIWVSSDRDGTVSRIDPVTHTIRQTVTVGHGSSALAADRDGVWAANLQDGTVSFVSAASNAVADVLKVGNVSDVCLLDGALWIAGGVSGTVLRVDPDTHRRHPVALDAGATALACGAGSVWATGDAGRLIQISPATNAVVRGVEVGAGSAALAIAGSAVWVANPVSGTVSRFDPRRGTVTATVALDPAAEPVAIATGRNGVWVANRHAQTLVRIDPTSAAVTERLPVDDEPRSVADAGGRLWVAMAAAGHGHRGGTLHVDYEQTPLDTTDIDPATSYLPEGWQILSLTNDGLTGYRRVGGPPGATIVPDLAEAIPAPSDSGRTYSFTVRPGIRYSTGGEVRASDIKRGIERSLHAKPAAFGLLSGIASIAADDAHRTIVFHLARPDPDFLYRLASPLAYAVPPGTPPTARVVAATGPYRITSFEPRRHIRLERNPAYRTWSTLAKPDGYADAIDVRMVRTPRALAEDVRAGRTDWAVADPMPAALKPLRRREPGLFRDVVGPQTVWFWLNTRVPPFDDIRARRAVSLALDRGAAVAAFGGDHAGRPTCHILPPNMQGYRPGCPSGPRNLDAARRLVARSGTRGAPVTVWTSPLFSALTPPLERALRSLGYRTRVRRLSTPDYFNRVADSRWRAQIGATAWQADYPSPSTFLVSNFSCRSRVPRSRDNSNFSQFCDPAADALMRRASGLQAGDPRAADEAWARAEHRVLDEVPAIPLLNNVRTGMVSSRLRNDQYHPQWWMLLDQAWVR